MAILSVNETTTFRWSFVEDVVRYAAEGIPAIGVWRQKLSDCGPVKGRKLLDQHRMKVSHLHWAGGFTGSDGRSFRESLDDAFEAIRSAAVLGASTLVVYSGARSGHTHGHARRLLFEALKQLAPEADELGVDLALEPMHPGCAADWTFLTSLDDVLCAIEKVGGRRLKLVLDTYHLGHEANLVERIAQFVPLVAIVQLGDARQPPQGEQNRCRLGEGRLPLKEIVVALKAAGYDGYYDVELLGEELESADYHVLLDHAKQAFSELVMNDT
ncbi:MAG: sugar phosphate isomerase/epimerase [Pirellulales bacterium]|nr:sugar phosphate isomerase/epimerase [Pirellulales bacterium]